jgi:hypothetical protein
MLTSWGQKILSVSYFILFCASKCCLLKASLLACKTTLSYLDDRNRSENPGKYKDARNQFWKVQSWGSWAYMVHQFLFLTSHANHYKVMLQYANFIIVWGTGLIITEIVIKHILNRYVMNGGDRVDLI